MELKTTKQTVMLNSFQHLHLNQTLCKKDEILNQVQDDNRMGFTLIELLVVVLIIGILAAVAVPQYQLAVDKARYSTVMPIIRAIKDAQEVYYLANGEYATTIEELDVDLPWEGTTSPDGEISVTLNGQYHVFATLKHNGNLQNAFMIWYDRTNYPGKLSCYAYTGERSERLCKSISGKEMLPDCANDSCKSVKW